MILLEHLVALSISRGLPWLLRGRDGESSQRWRGIMKVPNLAPTVAPAAELLDSAIGMPWRALSSTTDIGYLARH